MYTRYLKLENADTANNKFDDELKNLDKGPK